MLKVLNSDDADTDTPDDSASWLMGYWTGVHQCRPSNINNIELTIYLQKFCA